MKILLTIEYDGTDFCGWQIQPDKRTVQGVLSDALSQVFKRPVTLIGSGRTDSGVHAFAQKAHFEIESLGSEFPIKRLPLAVNTKLPSDVCVKDATIVPDDFEAQFSAKKKTYVYSFYLSRLHRPMTDRYVAHVKFDENKFDLREAEKVLEAIKGTHDFAAFSSSGSTVKTTERTIYEARCSREPNGVFRLEITGNGFLYNMVRIIAGTFVEVGLSMRPFSDVLDALKTGNRLKCGKTMPPCGLTLQNVIYDE